MLAVHQRPRVDPSRRLGIVDTTFFQGTRAAKTGDLSCGDEESANLLDVEIGDRRDSAEEQF